MVKMYFEIDRAKIQRERKYDFLYLKKALHRVMLENDFVVLEGEPGVYTLNEARDYMWAL